MEHYIMNESEKQEIREYIIKELNKEIPSFSHLSSCANKDQILRCEILVRSNWFDHEILNIFEKMPILDFLVKILGSTPTNAEEFELLTKKLHWVQVG